MQEDDAVQWTSSTRRFGNVIGLDPEAEWLLGTNEDDPGEARDLYLPRSLLSGNESGSVALRDAKDRPPFPFVISPEPGGTNGTDILDALDELAAAYDEKNEKSDQAYEQGEGDAPPDRLF